MAETIRRMQAAVVELGCYCVEVWDDTPEYKMSALEIPPSDDRDLDTIPMKDWDGRFECSVLNITSLQFFWTALVKGTDLYIETEAIDIKELKCL